MPHIRPVSDLCNHLSEISEYVHETAEPVFLTENGNEDMVVMSREAYENRDVQTDVYLKLKEAEIEAELNPKRYSHEEVFTKLRKSVLDKKNGTDV